MDDNTIIFWAFLGFYTFVMGCKFLYTRYCMSPTRIIIRDGDGIEYQYRNFIPSNRHVILLTNINSSMVIADDIEEQRLIDECSICHDVLETNVIKTECEHIFHKSCVISWINSGQNQSLKCPICRTRLSL